MSPMEVNKRSVDDEPVLNDSDPPVRLNLSKAIKRDETFPEGRMSQTQLASEKTASRELLPSVIIHEGIVS